MTHDRHKTHSSFRTKLITWVQNFVALGIVVWFVVYLWTSQEFLHQAASISARDAGVLSILIVFTWFTASSQGYVLFRASGARIGFFESFVLSAATSFGNHLPMRAGTLVRAHYMKSVHKMSYVVFGSIFSLRLVLTVITSGLIGFSTVTYIALSNGRFSIELLLIFLACAVVPFTVYFWKPTDSAAAEGRISKLWQEFAEGFHHLKDQPRIAIWCALLILAQNLLFATRFYVAARATGMEIDLVIILVLVPIATLVSFTAVTPGGIGFRESIMGYATFATGLQFSNGLFIGTIDRIMLLILTIVFGSSAFIWIWLRVNRLNKT
jgi:uncharacterized membrane protein YbhN (UPF0104 family)